MKLPMSGWKKTLRSLGYKVVWKRISGSQRKRPGNNNDFQYGTLEPRQLLAVGLTGDGQVNEGSLYELTLNSDFAVSHWVVNWGDGTTQNVLGTETTVGHIYEDGDTSATISAYATSSDGNIQDAENHSIFVNNVDPILEIIGESSVQQGNEYVLELSSLDPGQDQISSWVVDWGDGTELEAIAGSPEQVTHVYTATGDFTVVAQAFDEDSKADVLGSTLKIKARGSEGGETFNVLIDNELAGSFVVGTGYQNFVIESEAPLTPNQIKIEFTNDFYDPANGIDRNLIVDFIRIDGKKYQTEGTDVYSTGSWKPEDGIQPGFRESHALHANGYFQYDAVQGSTLKVFALGNEGSEQFNVVVDGEVVETFDVTQHYARYIYSSAVDLSAKQIRIEFINDLYDPANGIDRNLFVDKIRIDKTSYQTEADDVYSTGTWKPEDGIQPGFRNSQTLHSNGYFQYDANRSPLNLIPYTSNDIELNVTAQPSVWLPNINFELDGNQFPLQTGEVITDQFAELGVHVSTLDSNHPAMIFDSSEPTGDDWDLGTPSNSFGGPGIGGGGSTNNIARENILIISEDGNSYDPDDNLYGGTLVFEFDAPVMLDQVGLLDIANNGTVVRALDQNGDVIIEVSAQDLGKNSYQDVVLDALNVRRLEIELAGPGAVTDIVFCRDGHPIEPRPTNFYTVDEYTDKGFHYDGAGNQLDDFNLVHNSRARGATTTPDGNPVWVVKSNENVYVYDRVDSSFLGQWDAVGPEWGRGIGTDGANIWIVDAYSDKIYFYQGGAELRSGTHSATSSFDLLPSNYNPSGLAVLGNKIWVSDASTDKVFVYDLAGNSLGSWSLDSGNSKSSGITTNSEGTDLWVTDFWDGSIYVYEGAASLTSGSANASYEIDLGPGNHRPGGIAGVSVEDTNNPPSPVISAIETDTGSSSSDGITNDNTLLVSGTGEPGLTITLSATGLGVIGTTVVDGSGVWVVDTTSTALADGAYDLTATAAMGASVSDASSPLQILIDTTAPDLASVLSIDPDSGFNSADGITNQSLVVVSGTAEANTSLALFEETLGEVGSAAVGADGSWSVDVASLALAGGAYAFYAIVTDSAGNASSESSRYQAIIDQVAPGSPAILGISDDTGTSNNDGITNDPTQTINGTAEPGSVVSLSGQNAGDLGSVVVDAAGDWSIDIALSGGAYDLTAVATDIAGNESAPSQPFALVVDLSTPNAPIIQSIETDTAADDGVTSDDTLIFSGQAEPGTRVTLREETLGIVGVVVADSSGAWQVDLQGTPLAEGSYRFVAAAEDDAGNVSSDSLPFDVTVDTTIAFAPSIVQIDEDTGASDSDGITNDNTLVFSGMAEAGSSVSVFEATLGLIGIATADENGVWLVDATSVFLGDGDYIFTAASTDVAGNESPTSTPLNVTVDTSAPASATINSINADTGGVANDGVTNDNQLIFVGAAEPGSLVTLSESVLGDMATATTDSSGQWQVDLTATTLVDGSYQFKAVTTDSAGNVDVDSPTFNVIVDTAAPAVPSITRIDSDSGANMSDGITNDNTIVLTGFAEAGATVTVNETSLGIIGTAVADPLGVWELDATGTVLADGSYSFTAVAVDLAGNESGESSALAVEIDTVDPAAPSIDQVDDDTGAVNNDGVTNDNAIIVTGSSEPNMTITLSEQTLGVLGTAVADSAGRWQIDLSSSPLADGVYQFTALTTDAAGNVSGDSAVYVVTIDTQAPAVPSISVAGQPVAANLNLNNNQIVFTGIAEAGTAISISEGGSGFVGTAVADPSGVWVFDASSLALIDGTYSFSAIAEDLAGNQSPASNLQNIVLDTIAPDQPVIISIDADTGAVTNDGITSDNTLLFNGTAEPGAKITLQETVLGLIGMATADGNGDWQVDATSMTLADGTYAFTATATDVAGNESAGSTAFGVVVDTAGPAVPSIVSVADDNGVSNTDGITNDDTLEFAGFAPAGSTVSIFESGLGLVGTATAASTGAWTLDATSTVLADGVYAFTAIAEDNAGNVSPTSDVLSVTVDTASPSIPQIVSIDSDSGALSDDQITNDNTLILEGTAEPGSLVALTEATLGQLGTATADASGNWLIDITSTNLVDGNYSFQAGASDVAGNMSGLSVATEVVVDTIAPSAPSITTTGGAVTSQSEVTLAGFAEPNSQIQVTESTSGVVGNVLADGAGAWSLTSTFGDGAFQFSATATDIAGNTSSASSVLNVIVDTSIPSTPAIVSVDEDSGTLSTDGITNDDSLSFTGTSDSEVTVTLFDSTMGTLGTTTSDTNGDWTISLSSTLADGNYSFFVTAVDAAGNESNPSDSFAVTIDTMAPGEPSLFLLDEATGTASAAQATNDNTLQFLGMAEPGSIVAIGEASLGVIGSSTADASGMWTFNYSSTALSDGDYVFTATATDAAGNSSPETPELNITIDTSSPDAPIILAIAEDTGPDTADGVTSDNVLEVNGTAEAFTNIRIEDNLLGVVGTATVGADGTWVVDMSTTTLSDGTYNFQAFVTDAAGNESAAGSFAVTVDTAAPSTPSIIGVTFDTGSDTDDGVTSDNGLVFNGFAESGSVVTLTEATLGVIGVVTVNGSGVWEFDASGTTLGDGNYTFSVTAEDLAGNTSGSSADFNVSVDTTSPQVPTLDLDPAFDTPPLGDQTTVLSEVTLVGVAEPGSVVTLDGGESVTADASGQFSFAMLALSLGANAFTVTSTDLAGNESQFTQTVTRESDVPAGPFTMELVNDTGVSGTDLITTDPTIFGSFDGFVPTTVFFGFYEAYSDESSPFVDITAMLQPDGSFTLDQAFFESLFIAPLPDGEYFYFALADDMDDNTVSASGEFVYIASHTSDATVPTVIAELANDTGASDTDKVTSDPTITGVVTDDSPFRIRLELFDDNMGRDGIFLADEITHLVQPDGSFTIDEDFFADLLEGGGLPAGNYTYSLFVLDEAGNRAEFSDIFVFLPPIEDFVVTNVSSDTGRFDSDFVTRDRTVLIQGTGAPDAVIQLNELTLGDLGTVTADSSGDWAFSLESTVLSDGTYQFSVSENQGTANERNAAFTLMVDNSAQEVTDLGLAAASDTGEVGDAVTTESVVTISGVAEPISEVTLVGTGQMTVADANGDFSIENVELMLGRHDYQFEVVDVAGNRRIDETTITLDQPIVLIENGFVQESSQLVILGQEEGTRTVSFNVDPSFGVNSTDTFLVYLVNPSDNSQTLIDRGAPGTALFSLSQDAVEYPAGIVTFDGSVVEIDVSGIEGFDEGLLLFQLINNDGVTDSQVEVSEFSSTVDPNGVPSATFLNPVEQGPGEPLDVSVLNASADLILLYENIRFDSSTKRFTANLRVRNDGSDIGRKIAATFDDLPAGVTLLNASGVDGNGDSYISFRQAIPSYGLLAGQTSDAIRVEFNVSGVSPLTTMPQLSDGGQKAAPVLNPIGALSLMPGDLLRIDLDATDPDDEGFYYTLSSDSDLPNVTLSADGQLAISPDPAHIGIYQFEVLATDGIQASTQPVTLTVEADPVTATRISGVVLNTDSEPLVGVPIELGGQQVLTAADGTFELSFAGILTDDTLLIRGEALTGPDVYPFIAEKLPLMFGHETYQNYNNVIERPIYLPPIDVANEFTVDPAVDLTVTTTNIADASLFIGAGTLENEAGGMYTGGVSITEVPIELTPAALPEDIFPDLVVTIQPAGTVFTTPAPLSLPNLSGYAPGTEMILWSINPVTGLFDNVGTGVVSADGATVDTVTGGIRNGSWHMFANTPPPVDPDNDRNEEDDCDPCKETDAANGDNQPDNGPENDNGPSNGSDNPNVESSSDQTTGRGSDNGNSGGSSSGSGSSKDSGSKGSSSGTGSDSSSGGSSGPTGPTQSTSTGSSRSTPVSTYNPGGRRGMTVNGEVCSISVGPYTSKNLCGQQVSSTFGFSTARNGNSTGKSAAAISGSLDNANDTAVELHSGVLHKSHDLVTYQSLQVERGFQLHYDSKRADARPLVNVGLNNVAGTPSGTIIASKLSINRGGTTIDAPGYGGGVAGLRAGENFFQIPAGASKLNTSLQVDLRNQPSGLYEFESSSRFASKVGDRFVGTAASDNGMLLHVNSTNSPFGSGWGLSGLTEVVENPNGSVLLIDGDGGERLFEAPLTVGGAYVSPADDFSTLVKLGDGTFQRTHVDQTVEKFGTNNKIKTITDRNNNVINFLYNANDNIESITDPVGLMTEFRYSGDRVTEIEDPAGRITFLSYSNGNLIKIQDPDNSEREFGYDAFSHLVSETNKLGRIEKVDFGDAGRVEELTRKDGTLIKYDAIQPQGFSRAELSLSPDKPAPALVDAASRLVSKKVDANGNVEEVRLDRLGQLVDSTDSEGKLPEIDRNDSNLIERTYDARGNLTLIQYDTRGNIISVADEVSGVLASTTRFSSPRYSLGNTSVQTVDLNSDGNSDIISLGGSFGEPTKISMLFGDGVGGFLPARDSDSIEVSDFGVLDVADVNNDGVPDILFLEDFGDRLDVYLGNGDGSFQVPVGFQTADIGVAIQTADLNGDGFIDVVTSSRNASAMVVHLGDGTGDFSTFDFYDMPFDPVFGTAEPGTFAIGDLNHDLIPDLVVSNDFSGVPLSVFLGAGDGSFLEPTLVDFDGQPSDRIKSVDLNDINGDGDLDVIVGSDNMLILPGFGNGEFGDTSLVPVENAASLGSDANVSSVVDMDGDGDLDVIITEAQNGFDEGISEENPVKVFKNDGNGNFTQGNTVPSDAGFGGSVSIDLDNDGFADVLALNTDGSITPLRNNGVGDLSPTLQGLVEQIEVGNGPVSIAIGDFNEDGFEDAIVGNRNDQSLAILLGDGKKLVQESTITGVGRVTVSAAFDIDQDGHLDFFGYSSNNGRLTIRYGDGLGGFGQTELITSAGATFDIEIGDFNNDMIPDFVVAQFSNTNFAGFTTFLNNGDRTFSSIVRTLPDEYVTTNIDVGDIDNDGNLDLVVGPTSFDAESIGVFLGNGDGTFNDSGAFSLAPDSNNTSLADWELVDLNGDGNLDVIATSRVLITAFGNGDGTFQASVQYGFDGVAGEMDLADFNGDGFLDALVGSNNDKFFTVYYGDELGQFLTRESFLTPDVGFSGLDDLKAIDFNNDGNMDVVTLDQFGDILTTHLNSVDGNGPTPKTFAYDPVFNQMVETVDEEGRTVTYEIDAATGNRLSTTQVIGVPGGGDDIVTQFTYTSQGLLDTTTDPLGRVTDMDYNAQGLLERITYAVGTADEAFMLYEYDLAGNKTAVIDELGHRTEHVFDALNRKTQMTEADPDGAGPLASPVTNWVYDAHGNLKEVTDALSNKTEFVYDNQHRLIETIDANLESTTHVYDESGNIIRTVDRLGRETRFIFDQRNRLTETINAEGGRVQMVYDEDDNLIEENDENGNSTFYAYDARDRILQVTNAIGGTTQFEYDRVDNVIAMVDEIGRRQEMTFDELNRRTSTTLPDPDLDGPESAPVTTYSYDDASNLRFVTDALGNAEETIYDARNRMVRVINADPDSSGPLESPVTDLTYDDANRLIEVSDPLNRITTFEYDNLNRLTKETLPDPDQAGALTASVTTNAYDAEDNLVSETDAIGNVTEYEFDSLYRQTRIVFADPDGAGPLQSPVLQNVYDAEHQLVQTIDPLNRVTTFEYDLLGRIVRSTLPDPDFAGPDTRPITTYVYDGVSNLTSMTDALGNTSFHEYDDIYRKVRDIETDPDGAGPQSTPVTSYTFDAAHQLISTSDPLGRTTDLAYDQLGRLVSTSTPDPDGDGPLDRPVTSYQYDLMGNQLAMIDPLGNSTSYTYDNLYRTVAIVDADPDGVGPLDSPVTTMVYDIASQMVSINDPLNRTSQFDHDDMGRVVKEIFPDPDGAGPELSPEYTYVFDAMNNELSMTDALGNTTSQVYDNLYRKISIINPDPDGSGPLLSPVTDLTYDNADQLLSVSDPLNRVTQYEYDQLGRIISEIFPDPDGSGPSGTPEMNYVYDLMDNRVLIVDALGNSTEFEYDDLYRMIKKTEADPDGAGPLLAPATTYSYDIADQLLSISDPLGRTMEMVFDNLGRVVQEILPDPDGAGGDASPVDSFVYDSMDNRVSTIDALGNTTEYEYDNLYRLIRTTEADPDGVGPQLSPVTEFGYDAASQMISATDSLGRTSYTEYDGLGRVVRLIEADPDVGGPSASPETTYQYDLMNNLLSLTDSLGNVTQYEYDSLYRSTRTILEDPDGVGPQSNPTTTYVFDIASQMTAMTDPLGRETTYEYDDLGRVVLERYPDPDGVGPLVSPETSYAYDFAGNEISMIDAVGNATQYEYDNLYRKIRMIEADPDGAGALTNPVTEFSYDIASQLIFVSDPLNRNSTYFYDDLGRVVRSVQPDPDGAGSLAAPETTSTYDLEDNLLSTTDPLGNVTQYEYDNLYRMVSEIREDLDGAGPLGNPTTNYVFDSEDNLLSVTDSSGSTTSYTYDDLDRLFEETIELGVGNFETRRYGYDLEDNLIRKTDRNNRVIEYEYDSIYRMVEERWLDGSSNVVNEIQFEFDEASQMLRAEDVTTGSRYDYAYDDLSRVTQSVVNNGGPTVVFGNAYDAQSRRTERAAQIGGVNDFKNVYSYDGLNRLSRVDQAGQLAGNFVAEKRFDFGYNADNQMTSVFSYKSVAGGASDLVMSSTYGYDGIGRLVDLIHSGSSTSINDYDWTYDIGSRITQFSNVIDGSSDLSYDNTNQVTSVTHATQTDESYQYDEDGNRTNSGYATGDYNRVVSDGTFNYEYDAEGNRIRRVDIASGAVVEFSWDFRNRFISVTYRDSAGGPATQAVEHRYDVFNRWISKLVDVDGDGAGAGEVTRYEYDANQIVLAMDDSGTVTNRYVWSPEVDKLLADEQVGDQVYWTATDHLGSVRDVVDGNGIVVNHIVYDSFGNVASETQNSIDILIGFTGRPLEEVTGLQNNLNRWYDSSTGQWISEDPISFEAGDANLYRYVGNDVLNSIDPDGLDRKWWQRPFDSAKQFLQKSAVGRVGLRVGEANNKAARFLWNDVRPAAGDLVATTAVATYGGANALIGREEAARDAKDLARRIKKNSRFISAIDEPLNEFWKKSASEKLDAVLDLPGQIYEGVKNSGEKWFGDLFENINNGCYEQAANQVADLLTIDNIGGALALKQLLKQLKNAAKSKLDDLARAGAASSPAVKEFVEQGAKRGYDLTPGSGAPPIKFGQKGVSPGFSKDGYFKGADINDVAKGIKDGTIDPSKMNVEFVWVNGERVVVNNRSLTALSKAGKTPVNPVDMTGRLPKKGPDSLSSVLDRLDEMGKQGSDTIGIRTTQGDWTSPVREVVNIPGPPSNLGQAVNTGLGASSATRSATGGGNN